MSDLETQIQRYCGYVRSSMDAPRLDERILILPAPRRRLRPALYATCAVAAAVTAVAVVAIDGKTGVRVDTQLHAQAPASSVPATGAPPPQGASAPPGAIAARARATGIRSVPMPVAGGVAIRAATATGRTFSVVVPADLDRLADINVVPEASVGVASATTLSTYLTTLPAADVADGQCRELPGCQAAQVESHETLPTGAVLTTWFAGARPATTTVEMQGWTLVLDGPDLAETARVARSLRWSVDGDGFITLRSADPEVKVAASGVWLTTSRSGDPADGLRINVVPGCAEQPDVARPATGPALERFATTRPGAPPPTPTTPAYGGRWCVAGAYRVEALTGDAALLDRLYRDLRVLLR